MIDRVSKRFIYDVDNLIPNTIPAVLSSLINRKLKWYCIVEGKTDKYFYKNIKNVNLNNNTEYLYGRNNSVEEGGKDTVIASFNIIRRISKLNKYMDKYIFIVDHDYGGLTSQEHYIDNSLFNSFTITKPYSFENYFLKEENIKIIFKYYGIENDYYTFLNLYNQFAREIKEYTRLKSSTIVVKQMQSEVYDQYCPFYRKKHSYDDIFVFDFSNGKLNYNRKNLYDEISLMKRYVDNNESAKKYYKKYSYNLVMNNDFVRGHNAFDFLSNYLYQVHGIKLVVGNNEEYINIVRMLKVDIDIRNGLGKLIV